MQAFKLVCPQCKQETDVKENRCSSCGYDFSSEKQKAEIKTDDDSVATAELTSSEEKVRLEEAELKLETLTLEDIEIPGDDEIGAEQKALSDEDEQVEPLDYNNRKQKPLESRDDKFKIVKRQCEDYIKQNFKIYALFGFSEAGKTSFLYSLMQTFEQGRDEGFGGYTYQGSSWNKLKNELESHWEQGMATGTVRGNIFYYEAHSSRKKNHIVFLDIAGEHFDRVQDWSNEMTDFIATFLPYCAGYFLLFDMTLGIEERDKSNITVRMLSRSNKQMHAMVNFLSVAAIAKEIKKIDNPDEKTKKIRDSRKKIGKRKIGVPVALCLSKADMIETFYFEEVGRNVPLNVTPWRVMQRYWSEHYKSILKIVPHLKIEWLSSLGRKFGRAQRADKPPEPGDPLGLQSVFDFVVLNPPPSWAMPSKYYTKLAALSKKLRR